MAGAGFRTFSDGQVLTAAQVNTYLMEQSVMVFASSAARTSAIAAPSEGMVTYLTDSNTLQYYDGSSWQFINDADAIQNSIIDAKGDLIVGFSDNTPGTLAVGTNGHALVADSSTASGVKWANLSPDGTLITGAILRGTEERWNVVAAAATGTINLDTQTASAWHYTTNSSANWTLNVRGASGTTLDSLVAVGDSITVAFAATNGATAYRQTGFQIDGVSRTIRWQGGSAPAAGTVNATDVYTFAIIKTAATPTYVVLGSYASFA